jgi:serine/threonine-protein kinase
VHTDVRTFGKYLLDEEIARGGMSRVFAARLRGVGGFEKRLVVKQVLPELASDPRFVSMFVHEAKTLVQMSHPHIAPVFELGVVDGVYFLAMEYVEGATLAAILRDGALAPGLAAHVGAEICDALHYAHTRFEIVHRDVTPRNVIIDGAGYSRLLDFGIAAPVRGASAETFGTPGYLSPEQLRGDAVTPASDVFSLGAVLFEALTARRAFDANTVDEMHAALGAEGPHFEPSDAVPDALRAIVLRALALDPEARFRSASEFGRALRGWLASAHPEGVAPELGLRAQRAERAQSAKRRRISADADSTDADEGSRTPATREVRTIATSPALEAMIDSAGEKGESAGTVRIERRPRPTAEEITTAPVARTAARRMLVLPWVLAAALAAGAGAALSIRGADERSAPPVPDARAQHAPAPSEPPPEPPPRALPVDPPPPEPYVEPEVAPPAPRPATVALTVNASPWADVELDGRTIGRTPQRRVPIRAGRHTLVLRCPPLGREVRYAFDAEPGRPLTLVGDLGSDPPVVRRR